MERIGWLGERFLEGCRGLRETLENVEDGRDA